MKSEEFWSVEVGTGMGPLVVGTEYESLLEGLRSYGIEVDRLRLDRLGKVALPELAVQLVFSQTTPRKLVRIEVSDERLRFGSLSVIGKRAHEIVGLFKISRKQTLWSDLEFGEDRSRLPATAKSTEQSRELLARGTLWIPALGLGLTLKDGLVATVHLCDPADSPRIGSGPWTKEQQLLSEVRELPTATLPQANRIRKTALSVPIHLAFVASLGVLVWWAIQLQQRWDAATEVSAVVVGVDPPPPQVLPERITVSYHDTQGTEHFQTLGHMQFMTTPQLGDEVTIRFLPDAPTHALGPVASRDIGFATAFPYGIGILTVYSLLQVALFGKRPIRKQSRR